MEIHGQGGGNPWKSQAFRFGRSKAASRTNSDRKQRGTTVSIAPHDHQALVSGRLSLEIQAPKIHRSLMQFKAEFPPRTALVASPNQDSFARILVDQVY